MADLFFQMKAPFITLMTILATAPTIQAGVSSVGNGGGFAEMQAYQIDRSMISTLDRCLLSSNLCGMTPPEIQATVDLSQTLKNQNWGLIEINVTCEWPYMHPNTKDILSIDSCLLYSKVATDLGPSPLLSIEIAEKVFGARLKSANPQIDPTLAENLCRKLSQVLQFKDQVYVVPESGHSRLHVWTLESGNTRKNYVTLETLKSSTDLTSDIEASLACPNQIPQNLEFQVFQFMPSPPTSGKTNSVVAKSQITWNCAGQSYQALLYLDLAFESQELTSISPSLYQKQNN
jgi:hypothetical protein